MSHRTRVAHPGARPSPGGELPHGELRQNGTRDRERSPRTRRRRRGLPEAREGDDHVVGRLARRGRPRREREGRGGERHGEKTRPRRPREDRPAGPGRRRKEREPEDQRAESRPEGNAPVQRPQHELRVEGHVQVLAARRVAEVDDRLGPREMEERDRGDREPEPRADEPLRDDGGQQQRDPSRGAEDGRILQEPSGEPPRRLGRRRRRRDQDEDPHGGAREHSEQHRGADKRPRTDGRPRRRVRGRALAHVGRS